MVKRKIPLYCPNNTYDKQSAAIPNNGNAALFHSTNLYRFAAYVSNFTIIPVRMSALTQTRAFLFRFVVDKLSRNMPRCRSPPLSVHF